MSTKRFCDRCGREITGNCYSELSAEEHGGLRGCVRYTSGKELCEECRRSLDEWFKAGSDAK